MTGEIEVRDTAGIEVQLLSLGSGQAPRFNASEFKLICLQVRTERSTFWHDTVQA